MSKDTSKDDDDTINDGLEQYLAKLSASKYDRNPLPKIEKHPDHSIQHRDRNKQLRKLFAKYRP